MSIEQRGGKPEYNLNTEIIFPFVISINDREKPLNPEVYKRSYRDL